MNVENTGGSGFTERGDLIPTKMLQEGLLSDTSEALTCFTRQAFSAKLQAFMVNYVITVSGIRSVYS